MSASPTVPQPEIHAIETAALGKTYHGNTRALANIDLAVRQGDIFGLLGQNGAGKTTLIRILLDMIRPTAGRAAIMGFDAQYDGVEARRHVGYLPSGPHYYARMSGSDMFRLSTTLRGKATDTGYLNDLIERLELDPSRVVSTLSRGNQQKVGLILALQAKPDVVILDEPTSGLDPVIQEEVLGVVRDVAADGRTVFFSSHLLHEVEEICNRAAVLRAGELVGTFDLVEQRQLAARQVTVTFASPPDDAILAHVPSVQILSREENRVTFALSGEVDPLLKALASYHVVSIEAHAPTLEDFFFTLYRSPESTLDGQDER